MPFRHDVTALSHQRLTFGETTIPYLSGVDCVPDLVRAVLTHVGDVDTVLVVVDAAVTGHAAPVLAELADTVRVRVQVLDAIEKNKTVGTVAALLDQAVAHGLTRRSAVLAMGGGTVGNIAGLAAALLFRGVRLVHLPTTPVAAFDACVSLKQGVNLAAGKNLCGAYFAPSVVACDLAWLATVPRPQMLAGLAEMVKNVLVTAPQLQPSLIDAVTALPGRPDLALPALLDIGLQAKTPLLRHDPHERRAALVFEYGHTAGHAIEFASGGTIGHGEAVAWGMLAAADVARRRYGLSSADVATHHQLVGLLDLPDAARRLAGLDPAALRTLLAADNKRGHALCANDEVLMVLLTELGRPVTTGTLPLVPVAIHDLMTAIDGLRRGEHE
jgi:3-dehydroquinate synthase/2-deoxy-scyllo-inosose synthase